MTLFSILAFTIGLMAGLIVLTLMRQKYQSQNKQLKAEYERKLSDQERTHQFDVERIQRESDLERMKREEQNRSYFFRLYPSDDTSSIKFEIVQELSKIRKTVISHQEFAQLSANFLAHRLNLYYVGVYWVDTQNEFAKLIAGTGEGGKRMMARDHKVRLFSGDDRESYIGDAIAYSVVKNAVCFDIYEAPFVGIYYSYLSKDVQDDAIPPFNYRDLSRYFNSPALPQTRQSLILPLRTEKGVLGALDLHTSAMDMGYESAELLLPIANLIAKICSDLEE